MRLIPESTYTILNANGEMEIIDISTGAVVAVQRNRTHSLLGNTDKARQITAQDGTKYWVENSIDENNTPVFKRYAYTEFEHAAIVEQISLGRQPVDFAGTEGFPPLAVLRRWRRENPTLEADIREAKRDRSERLRAEALEIARAAETRDEAQVAAMKISALKWAAEADDPDTYKVSAKPSTAPSSITVNLVVNTGIDRTPLVEAKVIDVTPEEEFSIKELKESEF